MSSTTLSAPVVAAGPFANPAIVRVAAPVAVGAALLALWQLACTFFDVPAYLVPAPSVIARTLVEDWSVLSSALMTT